MIKSKWIVPVLFLCLFGSLAFAEGEVTLEKCRTVQARFKYDGTNKYCAIIVQCQRCVSGYWLNCNQTVTEPAWCQADGNSCPDADTCIADESLDQSVVDRLTDVPTSRGQNSGWPGGVTR